MFSHIEQILFTLKDVFNNNYNALYEEVNNKINEEYIARGQNDFVLTDLSKIDYVYVGDNPNLIENYDRNYIMLFPTTNYEISVGRRATANPMESLHINVEFVVGWDDPEILMKMLFRHIATFQEFFLRYQGFLPDLVTSINIKSYQFYNMILSGNMYVRALRFNMIIRYIPGEYEL